MTSEFHNILSNSNLETDDTLRVVRHDPSRYPPQIIYTPRSWLWTQDIETGDNGAFNGDPNGFIVPTIWPQGEPPVMTIEAAYKHFRVVFEQANVPLKAGQTYVLKMTSAPELKLTQGTAEDTIRAYAFVTWQGHTYMLPVQGVNTWGVKTENVWSVKANEDMQVNIGFGVWSVWGNIDGRIRLPSLEMLEVGDNYPPILELGQAKPPIPPAPAIPSWLWAVAGIVLIIAIALGLYLRGVVSFGGQTVDTPYQLLETVFFAIYQFALYSAGGLLIFEPIVQILKLILPLLGRIDLDFFRRIAGLRASTIAGGASIVTVVVISVAYLTRTQLTLESFGAVLALAAQVITAMVGLFGGSKVAYNAYRWLGFPGFGYKRS